MASRPVVDAVGLPSGPGTETDVAPVSRTVGAQTAPDAAVPALARPVGRTVTGKTVRATLAPVPPLVGDTVPRLLAVGETVGEGGLLVLAALAMVPVLVVVGVLVLARPSTALFPAVLAVVAVDKVPDSSPLAVVVGTLDARRFLEGGQRPTSDAAPGLPPQVGPGLLPGTPPPRDTIAAQVVGKGAGVAGATRVLETPHGVDLPRREGRHTTPAPLVATALVASGRPSGVDVRPLDTGVTFPADGAAPDTRRRVGAKRPAPQGAKAVSVIPTVPLVRAAQVADVARPTGPAPVPRPGRATAVGTPRPVHAPVPGAPRPRVVVFQVVGRPNAGVAPEVALGRVVGRPDSGGGRPPPQADAAVGEVRRGDAVPALDTFLPPKEVGLAPVVGETLLAPVGAAIGPPVLVPVGATVQTPLGSGRPARGDATPSAGPPAGLAAVAVPGALDGAGTPALLGEGPCPRRPSYAGRLAQPYLLFLRDTATCAAQKTTTKPCVRKPSRPSLNVRRP